MDYGLAGFQSWVPPEFVWSESDDVFLVEVSASDCDLVEFMAEGKLEVLVWPNQKRNRLVSLISDDDHLVAKLRVGLYQQFRRNGFTNGDEKVVPTTVYFHTACALPDTDEVAVIAGIHAPQTRQFRFNRFLSEELAELYQKHKDQVAEFDRKEAEERKRDEALRARFPNQNFFPSQREQRPKVSAAHLLPHFPKAVRFPLGRKRNSDGVIKEALKQAGSSGWSAPRDGQYSGIICPNENQQRQCLISWEPHDGLPAYPEIRWTVQKLLPRALAKPRQRGSDSPSIELPEERRIGIDLELISASGELFTDVFPDDKHYEERISAAKEDVARSGFEAFAWYQPFHAWDECSWGIYFDAEKLDDLALLLFDEFRAKRSAYLSYGTCCQLALGLVFTHEFFHARVEAALTWMELNVSNPRYLRYKRDVYHYLQGTDDWLEEALANWASWEWFQNFAREHLSLNDIQIESLNEIIEHVLDLSPAGYNNWRVGGRKGSWRVLASQMIKGKSSLPQRNILPLESLLSNQRPYDLRSADIPTFFVGEGTISAHLENLPNTINIPSRKEVIKALKHFGYKCHKAGGKGSHEKWIGPKNRFFTLPQRDPLSKGVFQSFLDHFSLDKKQYVRDVRPNL